MLQNHVLYFEDGGPVLTGAGEDQQPRNLQPVQPRSLPQLLQEVGLPRDPRGVNKMSASASSRIPQEINYTEALQYSEDPGVLKKDLASDYLVLHLPASLGSRGHPEFCMRPCIFFARGECPNGTQCQYCHLDHSRKPFHLDKSNREQLRSLHCAAVITASVPLVKNKMDDVIAGALPAARQELIMLRQEIIRILEASLAKELQANPHARTHMSQKLKQAFAKLSLPHILKHAIKTWTDEDVSDSLKEIRTRIQILLG
eukprot:TRINITY_DN41961_c0_g1_i1.p1 TRINITY_DN41961_c0_g1~~TRINITY_DN41961_c0_g1_i1.p1  ORF type:complete len:258 (+),score=45.29 TRINITY_DN41961_c0_g1_i1:69-842(+)